ncbi:serine hydrolase domain-containing protein [Streptomyces sp. NPDC057136]|uniref:serine hydrolase domain-containing protein n=1 Tax=Streptomyces sp. NPDC057136 TaxID=3346029 RepID=UPI0036399CD7
MPILRALLAAPLVLSLLGLGTASLPSEPHLTPAASYLPRLVVQGGAPAAALQARNSAYPPYDFYSSAGSGIRPEDRFRAGSITKTFVATVVLQLAAEGRLRLSDPVERYLPGLIRGHGNDGRRITLRSLLNHTSGLYDYTEASGVVGGVGPSAPALTAEAAVRAAVARDPAPVRGIFAYSNTNYAVLGLVVQRITGHSYATEIRHRVLVPLRLDGTSLPGARTGLPEPHSRGFHRDRPGGTLRDVTALDPRFAGAAGELVSTLADLNRFYTALLGGRLLPPAQVRALLDTRTAQGAYGLGIYPQKLSCGTTVWGHDGRIPGSYVRTATTHGGGRSLTFRVNTDTLPDETLETALLEAEFCRSPATERRRP